MSNPAWMGTVTAKLGEAKYRGRCYSTGAAIAAGDRVVMLRRCGELEIHSCGTELYRTVREMAYRSHLDGNVGARWFDVTTYVYPELATA